MLTGGNTELIRRGTLHADSELLHHLLRHFDIRHPMGTLYLNRKIFRRQSRSNQQRTQKLTAVPDIDGDMILSEPMSGKRKRKMPIFPSQRTSHPNSAREDRSGSMGRLFICSEESM